jgi:predicted TIM-barrel fold metal-dependent hydrolase
MIKEYFLDIPKFQLFDFHRHASTIEEFDKNLNQFNIGRFCLMPCHQTNDFQNLSSYIEKIKPYREKFKENALIFGALDFAKDKEQNSTLLEKQKRALDIKGIKLHPEQGFIINKKSLKPYFAAISDVLGYDAPIYIHTDWPLLEEKGYAPDLNKDNFDKIVSFFPEFKYIMGHAGGSGAYLNIWKSCKKFPNVYIETSMAPVTSPLEEVIWKFGPERLLFGSNYPFCATSIEIVKIFSLYKICDEDKRSILQSNAEVLF